MPNKPDEATKRDLERWLALFEAIHQALLSELRAYDKRRRPIVIEVR
jgi:hypothetical protein